MALVVIPANGQARGVEESDPRRQGAEVVGGGSGCWVGNVWLSP
jgi:hypothetical protein